MNGAEIVTSIVTTVNVMILAIATERVIATHIATRNTVVTTMPANMPTMPIQNGIIRSAITGTLVSIGTPPVVTITVVISTGG